MLKEGLEGEGWQEIVVPDDLYFHYRIIIIAADTYVLGTALSTLHVLINPPQPPFSGEETEGQGGFQ